MSLWVQSVAVLLMLSTLEPDLATRSAGASRPAQLQDCAVTVSLHHIDDAFANPASIQAQSALLFRRLPEDAFSEVLAGTASGGLFRANALFSGPDNRWRLWRPVPLPDDPDAFIIEPAQSHYLIKPDADAGYRVLIVIGIPEQDLLTWPVFVGRKAESKPGNFFVVQPDAPENCALRLDTLARDIGALLE
jgi:hypothetical protein